MEQSPGQTGSHLGGSNSPPQGFLLASGLGNALQPSTTQATGFSAVFGRLLELLVGGDTLTNARQACPSGPLG